MSPAAGLTPDIEDSVSAWQCCRRSVLHLLADGAVRAHVVRLFGRRLSIQADFKERSVSPDCKVATIRPLLVS